MLCVHDRDYVSRCPRPMRPSAHRHGRRVLRQRHPLVTATIDPRINAIVPGIAWNTLNSSLYPKDVYKSAWGNLLILDLIEAAPDQSPDLPGILTGALLGFLTPSQQALLARSGTGTDSRQDHRADAADPGHRRRTVPLAGSRHRPAAAGSRRHHPGQDDLVLRRPRGLPEPAEPHPGEAHPGQHAGLAGSVRNQDPSNPADDIPNFQWVDQSGEFYSSDLMPSDPLFQGTPISASGKGGILPIVPFIGGSGPGLKVFGQPLSLFDAALLSTATAAPAANAINLTVPVPTGTQIVGAPQLTFTYSGLGTGRALYAQIVDDKTGLVLGNLATPIPVTLDGRSHTVTADWARSTALRTPRCRPTAR